MVWLVLGVVLLAGAAAASTQKKRRSLPAALGAVLAQPPARVRGEQRPPVHAAAPRTKLYDFPLEKAAYPFLMAPETIWQSLPGENAATIPGWGRFRPGVFDRSTAQHMTAGSGDEPNCGSESKLSRDVTQPNVNSPELAYFVGYDGAARTTDLLRRYTMRAFSHGKNWVKNTTGRVGWSVWETESIAAFLLLLDGPSSASPESTCWPSLPFYGGWKGLLAQDVRDLRTWEGDWPAVTPARVMAEALALEIDAALGALGAYENALGLLMTPEGRHSLTLYDHVGEAAAWFGGDLDLVGSFQATIGAARESFGGALGKTDVTVLLGNLTGLSAELGRYIDVYQNLLGTALQSALNEIETKLLALGKELLSELGISISADLAAGLAPVVAQFVQTAIAFYEFASRDERPPWLDWKRGTKNYLQYHLNAYGTLMFRAMWMHVARMRTIRTGRIGWQA